MIALLHFVVALSELLFAGLESPLDLLELIVALRYLLLEVTLELEEFLLDFEEFLLLKYLCFTLCFGEDGTRLLPEELLGHKPRKGCAEDQRAQANDDDCNGSHSLSVIKVVMKEGTLWRCWAQLSVSIKRRASAISASKESLMASRRGARCWVRSSSASVHWR